MLAIMLIVVFMPLIIIIYILLFFTQGKPVLFRQMRSGKYRKPFCMYKFRSLKNIDGDSLSMEHREFTFLGKILRKTGLDELPQLIHVIKGEMSFIGPRPMPIAYEAKYSKDELKRFNVTPGITGWAQVHGKNDISWGKRFELDLWYVEHISLTLDIQIMAKTFMQFVKVIFDKNSKPKEMQVFNGSNLT